jgi:hypothetical protein
MLNAILRTATVLCLALVGSFVFGGSTAHAGPFNFVANGDFETLTPGNSLGAAGGYFCRSGTTCVSNVANWASECRNNACGAGGTPDSLLFANTNGSAFNGNRGLWAMGQNGTTTGAGVPNSPTGGNFVAFDGDSNYNAAIWQTITGLIPGAYYYVSFYQGAAQQRNTHGATTEWWQVSLGSQTLNSHVMNNVNHGWVPWEFQRLEFRVPTTSTGTEVLRFLSMGTPNNLPPVALLDGVSLTNAPEPQTYAMMGLALAAIPWIRKRRK